MGEDVEVEVEVEVAVVEVAVVVVGEEAADASTRRYVEPMYDPPQAWEESPGSKLDQRRGGDTVSRK